MSRVLCSVAFLLPSLSLAAPPKSEDVLDLIEQLGDDDFQAREKAQAKLAKYGEAIQEILEREKDKAEDLEVERRIQKLLDRLENIRYARLLAMEKKADLHYVGVYRGVNGSDCAYVHVKKTDKPIILVFTAYRHVKWQVKVDRGAKLVKVLLGGYYMQEINGVRARVERYGYRAKPTVPSSKRLYYAYRKTSSRYRRVQQVLKKLTGKAVKSFQGQYSATKKPFIIGK